MSRVVMFVLNDVRHDARVQREAASLAQAGHVVTVVGRPRDVRSSTWERETRDGFEIVRVPVPGRLRRLLLDAGGGRGGDPQSLRERAIPAPAALRGARLLVRAARAPARTPLIGGMVAGLDLLARWRMGTVAWGRAAADAVPSADVWHAHDLNTVPAALAAQAQHGGRFVYDAHELFLEAGDMARRPRWARSVLRRLEVRAITSADAVVTVNEGVAAELQRIARPRRLVVAHNAAPLGPVQAHDGRLRLAAGISPRARVVVYHGSFAPGRGVEVLLAVAAMRELEDVHFVFLGAGAGREAILRAAGDPMTRGRVHLLPPVDPEEVPGWISGADVGALPIAPTTLNHRLSTPNKLFECLAAGLPIVASDFPGIRSVVLADPAAPLGVLVDPTDGVAVARGIRSILAMPTAERRALRERAKRAARERWNWSREATGIVDLYAEIAGSGTPIAQRITFVLPTDGAHDSRTRRMANSLATRGHDVLIIARASGGLPLEETLTDGCAIRRVDAGPPPRQTEPAIQGPRRVAREARRIWLTALRSRRQARAALTVDRPADLYHAMGFLSLPVAIALARKSGAPFIYDARDLYSESNNLARLPRMVRAIFIERERRWARKAAAVLTVNRSLAAELERRLGVERPAVVMNAQPAWDPPDPRPDLLRSTIGLTPGTQVVLYHGGFMPDRGLPQLVAAMSQPGLERVHLALLGDGAMRRDLERLANEPAVVGRIHLLPPVPPSELLAWVASADLGAMVNQPRTTNERLSTPNKLFECLAAGVPVVSSDFPERRRIVLGDPMGPLGAMCDPTEPSSIAAALRSILELAPPERAALRERCRAVAATRYEWGAQLAVLLDVYGRVTGRPW